MDPSASYTLIVDDRDERIVRDASWVNLVGNDQCTMYFNSGRRATKPGSKFTFQFNGTAVEVHGGVALDSKPSLLSCTVDGNPIQSLGPPTLGHSKKDQVLCGGQELDANKPHTLEVTLQQENAVIDLDYVLYETTYDKLRNGDVLYYHSARMDAFNYMSTWTETNDGTRMTVKEQATASFSYFGSDVTAYTVGQEAKGRFRGELYVDTDTGDSFAAKAASTLSGVDGCAFYQLYKGGGSSVANHSVLFTYRGGANLTDNTPLELNFITLIAQNVPQDPSESQNPPLNPPPNPPPDPPIGPSHKGLSAGAIAGIAIGAVLGVTAIFLIVFFVWRRRHSNARWGDNPSADPFFSQPGEQPTASRSGKRLEMGLMSTGGNGSQEPMLSSHEPAPSSVSGRFQWMVKQMQSLTQTESGPSSSRGPIRLEPEPERILVHSDSGLRLNNEDTSRFVEVPPVYTES